MAISGHQWASEAISGHQRPSVAIRGAEHTRAGVEAEQRRVARLSNSSVVLGSGADLYSFSHFSRSSRIATVSMCCSSSSTPAAVYVAPEAANPEISEMRRHPSVVIRGHHKPSVVIRGRPRPSVFITCQPRCHRDVPFGSELHRRHASEGDQLMAVQVGGPVRAGEGVGAPVGSRRRSKTGRIWIGEFLIRPVA